MTEEEKDKTNTSKNKKLEKKEIKLLEKLAKVREEKQKMGNENSDEEIGVKFLDLGPDTNSIDNEYKQRLDYALDQKKKNIRNIAITGGYGAGKSSIIYSYFNTTTPPDIELTFYEKKVQWFNDNIVEKSLRGIKKVIPLKDENTKNYINIAFNNYSDFKSENNSDVVEVKPIQTEIMTSGSANGLSETKDSIKANVKNAKQDYTKEIERHIILQLVHQVNSKFMYQSVFDVRRENPRLFIASKALFLLVYIVLSYMIFFVYKPNVLLGTVNDELFKLGIFEFAQKYTKYTVSLLLWSACSLGILYNILIQNKYRMSIKKLKLSKFEVDLYDNNVESYIDKYYSELLLLFKISGVKIFVFEDLDRLNDTQIFEKLKEMNLLLNHDTSSRRTYKFVYLVRDDLFKSEDRVKFFDFIIPVVPVINYLSAKDKFEDLIRANINEEYIPSPILMYVLARYVKDMRLLKNIVNEYQLYLGVCEEKEENKEENKEEKAVIDVDKVFALILYKNLFPEDFTNLQNGKGVLYDKIHNEVDYNENENDETIVKVSKMLVRKKFVDISYNRNISLLYNDFLTIEDSNYLDSALLGTAKEVKIKNVSKVKILLLELDGFKHDGWLNNDIFESLFSDEKINDKILDIIYSSDYINELSFISFLHKYSLKNLLPYH